MSETTKMSMGAVVLHYFAFFPMVLTYFVFEVLKVILTKMKFFAIPLCILALYLSYRLIPSMTDFPELNVLLKVFNREEWVPFLTDLMGKRYIHPGAGTVLNSIILILFIIAVYVLPAFLLTCFVLAFGEDLTARLYWDEREVRFRGMLQGLYMNSADRFSLNEGEFVSNRLVRGVINVILILVPFFLSVLLKSRG